MISGSATVYRLRILRSLAMCRFAAALPFTMYAGFFPRVAFLRRGAAARRFAVGRFLRTVRRFLRAGAFRFLLAGARL